MGEPPSFCTHAKLLKDGREHTVEVREECLGGDFIVSASPIFDPKGQLIGSVNVARDVTERKMLKARLVKAQKMEAIGTLAGGIAHDFNNILGAIMGYTEMTLKDIFDNEKARRRLENVLQASQRAMGHTAFHYSNS